MSAEVEDPRFPGQRFTVPRAGMWRMTASLPLGRSGRNPGAQWRPHRRRRRRVVDVYLPGDWPPETTETAVTFSEETDL